MEWQTAERPGYFGKRRAEILKGYDEMYGKDNWRIMWQWGREVLPFITACQIYEDGFYADSFKRVKLWKELVETAKDVYDHNETDVESGLDYLVQKGNAHHLQDISIRRVVLRRGWSFKGSMLVQIRNHSEYWGKLLSPGKVPFHIPELIIEPRIEGWWDAGSIEDFWQSNKVLQKKDNH